MKSILLFSELTLALSAYTQTTWYEIATDTDKQLNVIDFADNTTGYIGGADSLLLKTTDGGKTWSTVNYSGVTFFSGEEAIVNLKFTSADVGYMSVGPYGGTYKTTDGGVSWTALSFTGNMCFSQGLYFWDEENGVIGGSGCFQGEHAEVMSNGNLSSSTINTPSWNADDVILDIDFLDADFGLAVSQSRFLRTTDGGATWDTIPSGTENHLTSIAIINDTLAYAGYLDTVAGFGALMSTNGGLSWSMDVDMATFFYPDYNDVGSNDAGHIYVVGGTDQSDQGIILENKIGLWNYYTVDHYLYSMDTYDDSTVFAVGDSGLVVTNVDPALLSADEWKRDELLFSIHPNPSRDYVNIQLDDPSQIIGMTIWDLNGRQILSYDQFRSSLNLQELEKGIYILEIMTHSGRFRKRLLKK